MTTIIETQRKTDKTRWEFFVDCAKSDNGQKLSHEQFNKWLNDDNRQLICVFCSKELDKDSIYCPLCKEYKGLIPLIEGWNY